MRKVNRSYAIIAEEPTGEKASWFSWKKERSGKWRDDLVYMVMYLGATGGKGRSAEGVYWYLRSWATKNRQVNFDKTFAVSQKRIGRRLGLSSKTVRDSFAFLASEGIIKFDTNRKGTTFQLLKDLTPVEGEPTIAAVKPKPVASKPVETKGPKVVEKKSARLLAIEEDERRWKAEVAQEERERAYNRKRFGKLFEPLGWKNTSQPKHCEHPGGQWFRCFGRQDVRTQAEKIIKDKVSDWLAIDIQANEETWDCHRCEQQSKHFGREFIKQKILTLSLSEGPKTLFGAWLDMPEDSGIVWEQPPEKKNEPTQAIN
jgi:hypothetical protein